MKIRRGVFGLLASLLSTSVLCAQSVTLTEAPLAQRCVRNEVTMELAGTITVKQDEKDVAFPHKATARHVFLERYLEVNGAVADQAARFYTTAEGTINFNNNAGSKRSLRGERSFMAVQRTKDKVFAFSPKGALTREEVDLTEHFDTMAVAGLLPGKAIEVGKSWTIANRVVLALCDFEGLLEHHVEGKLELVKGNLAVIKIVGDAKGIDQGAEVKTLVNAQLIFEIKEQHITALEWTQKDEPPARPRQPRALGRHDDQADAHPDRGTRTTGTA